MLNHQDQEDKELLSKYSHTGDQLWLVKLFHRYEHLIYGICLKYTNDPEWSKDLKSQIYEKLVARAKGLDALQFKSWLYTFAKNLCLDELRKKQNKVSTLNRFRKFQINIQEVVDSNAEERLIERQDEEHLARLMENAQDVLNEKQRLCVRLFFFQRYSYLEIGKETGMNINEVKSHLQNGKRKMKVFIHQELKNYV